LAELAKARQESGRNQYSLPPNSAEPSPPIETREIVDFINEDRKSKAESAGAKFPSKEFAKLRHDSFMDKVPEVLGKDAPKFLGTSFYKENGWKKQQEKTTLIEEGVNARKASAFVAEKKQRLAPVEREIHNAVVYERMQRIKFFQNGNLLIANTGFLGQKNG
jgi:hypothetical protein